MNHFPSFKIDFEMRISLSFLKEDVKSIRYRLRFVQLGKTHENKFYSIWAMEEDYWL
jgi:hypothetical protein